MRSYKNIFPFILNTLSKNRFLILIIIATSIIWALNELRGIEVQGSFDRIFEKETQEAQVFERSQKIFGSNEKTLLYIKSSTGILNKETLHFIRSVSQYASSLPEIIKVHDLSTAKEIKADRDNLMVEGLIDFKKTNMQIADQIKSSSFAKKNIISKDLKKSLVLLYFSNEKNERERLNALEKVELFIQSTTFYKKNTNNKSVSIQLYGGPYLQRKMVKAIMYDFKVLVPLLFLMIAIIFFCIFKSFLGTVLPLSLISIGLILTLGIMSFTKTPLSATTSFLPVILLAIGASYSIYYLAAFYKYYQEDNKSLDDAIKISIYKGYTSIFIATFTTCSGFYIFAFSRVQALKDLGIFLAIGVAIMGALALTFLPTMLQLLKPQKRILSKSKDSKPFLTKVALKVVNLVLNSPTKTLLLAALLSLVSLYYAKSIRPSFNLSTLFGKDSSFNTLYKEINNEFGTGIDFTILLESKQRKMFKRHSSIKSLYSFQEFLKSKKDIFYTTSMINYLGSIAPQQNQRLFFDDKESVVENLFLFTFLDQNPLRDYVSSNYKTAKIEVRTRLAESSEFNEFINSLKKEVNVFFKDEVKITITGKSIVMNETNRFLINEQAKSLIITVFIVFLLFLRLYRSTKIASISLIPNIFPVILNFGAMGIFDIPLDFTTILIASGVFGIAVDDTVHFLESFYKNIHKLDYPNLKRKLKKSESKLLIKTAIIQTTEKIGGSVLKTSITLTLGFSILLFSGFQGTVNFGFCMVFTLFFCAVADLVIIPAILIKTKI